MYILQIGIVVASVAGFIFSVYFLVKHKKYVGLVLLVILALILLGEIYVVQNMPKRYSDDELEVREYKRDISQPIVS
jgi:hypothetical protein